DGGLRLGRGSWLVWLVSARGECVIEDVLRFRSMAVRMPRRRGARAGRVGILAASDSNPGISQIEISRLLDLDKATIVALMYRLEKAGWATRKQAAEDRRRHELYLTAKGKRKLKTLRKDLDEHEERFRQRFTPQEFELFIDFLQRVYQDDDQEG